MGMVCFDYDDDGDTDVFVCNDASGQFPVSERRARTLQEIGLLAGVAYDVNGNANGSMGADCGDYDNDGQLDLFMTDYSNESPVLYRNRGQGSFDDVTCSRGRKRHVSSRQLGQGLVDFDNDGDRDLFIACGHFMDNIHDIDDRTAFKVPNMLLMNTGDKRFVDVSKDAATDWPRWKAVTAPASTTWTTTATWTPSS